MKLTTVARKELSLIGRVSSGVDEGGAARVLLPKPYFGGQGNVVYANKDGSAPPGFEIVNHGGVPMVAKPEHY